MKRRLALSVVAATCAITVAEAQLYVQNGNTLTIETNAVLHSEGDLVNNGVINGAGFLDLRTANAQTITGTGTMTNLRVSGGANVTPGVNLDLDKLDVASASSLTIPPTQYVLTTGQLSNAGTVTVENTASLVQGPSSGLTNTGTFNVRKQGTAQWDAYNYWSSPVTAGIMPGSYRYRWDPHNSTQDYGDDLDPDPGWFSFSGVMTVGTGYAGAGGGLVNFSGTVNNGVYAFPMIYYPFVPGNTNPGTPFNLMGNPYPSAIRCSDLVSDNADVDGAIYFWDDDVSGGTDYSTTDYAVWNGTGSLGTGAGSVPPNGFISTGQGFMIRALAPGATLNVDNQMRVDALNDILYANDQMFKLEAEPQRLYLSLEGNDRFNQILIGMVEDATDEQDRLYDALKIRGNQSVALAAMLFEGDDREFSILGFPAPSVEKTIPLNVFVDEAGEYDFHANTIEGFEDYELYLEDRSTFTYYPMIEGTQVPFQLNAGDINGRFFLHINSELITGIRDLEGPSMQAHIYDGMLNVNTMNIDHGNSVLELLDMQGRLVWTSSSPVSDRLTADVSNLSRGIYVVRLVTPDEMFTERVMR